MTNEQMISVIEGLLYLAGEEGLFIDQIQAVLQNCPKEEIKRIIEKMKETYKKDKSRGLMIIDRPNGWQLTTKPFMSKFIEKFVETPKPWTLSQASLETLAIIAYKQPISRVAIEDIRGVKSEKALQTLVSKGLIKEVGRAEGTGRAILYGVTENFFIYFGLSSLKDLPPLENEALTSESMEESDLFYEKFKQTISDL